MSSARIPSLVVRALFLATVIVCVPSCGNSQVPCYPVQGEVFVRQGNDRTPAAGALVVFHPTSATAAEAPWPSARVGEDGKFTLTTYVNGDGAPAGDYSITIEWREPRPPPPYKPKFSGDKLRGRYSDPRASTLAYSVAKDKDNTMPAIELAIR